MNTKTVFLYDENTGVFKGIYEAQPSPEELGEFITPVHSTEDQTPPFGAGEIPIRQNGKWIVVPIPVDPTVAPHIHTLDELKALKKVGIEMARDAACVANVNTAIADVTHTWQADSRSQQLLSNAVLLASAGITPCPPVWRTQDNVDVAVTIADLAAIVQTIAAQTQNAYVKSWQLKAQVDAAAIEAEVDVIVWAKKT